jgi:ribulose-5-phosphate 4-epimerase/fuculose-1-phosphate aldolase
MPFSAYLEHEHECVAFGRLTFDAYRTREIFMSSLDDTLDHLVTANHILADHGVLDAFGHISVRHPERADRYLISCSRGPAGVAREDIMELTLESEPVELRGRRMIAERPIHGRIYARRPDVNAICHNHSSATIPFGASDVPMPTIIHTAALTGGTVPVWDIADDFGATDMLVITEEMGTSLAAALGPARVVLMRGHGSTVVSSTLREVVFASIYLQLNAQVATAARGFSNVRYLSDEEIECMTTTLLTKPLSQDRAWDEWSRRVRTDR